MLNDMIEWETEEISIQKEAKLFQKLINNGQAWTLQGAYGRRAMELIESGYCTLGTRGFRSYLGGYTPSRYEVQKGTKGSLEYKKRREEERYNEI